MKRLGISMAVLLTAALTAFVLNFAGVFAFRSADGSALAARISASLSDKAGQVVHVTCPDRIPQKRGGIEDCQARVGSRTTIVRVVQDDSRGHLHWDVDDPSVLLAAPDPVATVRATPPEADASTTPFAMTGCDPPARRPTVLTITCADGKVNLVDLRWSSWNETSAIGSGALLMNDCEPSCVAGHARRYPLTITLDGLSSSETGVFFMTAHVRYTGPVYPPGPVTEDFELIQSSGD